MEEGGALGYVNGGRILLIELQHAREVLSSL